jgi:alanine dehydrogenase
MELLWLSEKDVASLIHVKDAIPLVEQAFLALGTGRAQMPPKTYLDFKEYQGDLRAMPAYLPVGPGGKPFAGVKVVNSHPKNPEKGLPTVSAVLVLNDPATGMPLAVMAAGALTDVRTGAAGGVAAKHLARPNSTVVGLVGCGRQAITQLKAAASLWPIREVRVAGRDLREAQEFCKARADSVEAEFVPCAGPEQACQADVVITTTPSRQPVVKAAWIRPGTHINAIGADAPGKQELESAILAKARVVVDRAEQAFHSGEVNVPLSTGALKPEQVVGDLGEIVAGKKKGRLSAEDITVFDSTGLAVQDVAVGAWVYQKAVERKIGTWLTF